MLETMVKGTVRLTVPEILRERGISVAEFQRMTGLAYNTASSLARGYVDRLDFKTLASVCEALNLQPGDLLKYVPYENQESQAA